MTWLEARRKGAVYASPSGREAATATARQRLRAADGWNFRHPDQRRHLRPWGRGLLPPLATQAGLFVPVNMIYIFMLEEPILVARFRGSLHTLHASGPAIRPSSSRVEPGGALSAAEPGTMKAADASPATWKRPGA